MGSSLRHDTTARIVEGRYVQPIAACLSVPDRTLSVYGYQNDCQAHVWLPGLPRNALRQLMNTLFDMPYESLPEQLPVFPLTGAVLLPRCRLPLNIFETRYLEMTEDSLASDRLIGMVQPVNVESGDREPALFRTGCAGRITSFSETDDGRILIILTGVSRFDVEEELDVDTHYRQIIPAWEAYRPDLTEPEDGNIDRERLYASLRVYFETRDFDTDWELLQEATDESLINSLVMSCPFDPTEKQSLLEAHGLDERTRLMSSLLDMAALRRATSELSLH